MSCGYCGGEGYITDLPTWVPYGSTWVTLPTEYSPCPDCYEKGECPQCGASIEETSCDECGWEDLA